MYVLCCVIFNFGNFEEIQASESEKIDFYFLYLFYLTSQHHDLRQLNGV